MTIEQAFGKAIRRLRKERELSQDTLAQTSQLDRTFISLIECGKKNPTLISIFQLSRGLNVTTDRILSEVETIMAIHGDTSSGKDLLEGLCPAKKNAAECLEEIVPERAATILLVDDEEVTRDYLLSLLTQVGYDVIMAGNGHEAVALYRECPEAVDLVIMDVVLPTCNGIDAVCEIRALNPQVKVLFVSGYEVESLKNIPHDFPFLQKPIDPHELISKIRQTMIAC